MKRQRGIVLLEWLLILVCIAAGVLPVADQISRDQKTLADLHETADAIREAAREGEKK